VNGALEQLPILVLNPFSRCNCRCRMCDIWKRTGSEAICRDTLERELAGLEGFGLRWAVLSGGEPLMHPDIFGLCAALRARNLRVTLLTAGLLLERHAAGVAVHVDDLIISLDGPAPVHDSIRGVNGAFARLAAGIAAVRAQHPDFPIAARSTVQRRNHAHLGETACAARQLHLDSISFLAADVESTAFHRPATWPRERQEEVGLEAEQIPVLEAQIEALIASGECGGFIAESPEKLQRIVHHFRARLGLARPVAPRCNAPWVSAVVEADGSVRPCFFHEPIGRIGAGQTLAQVLNGPQAVAFRGGLDVTSNPVCRRCVCSLNFKLVQITSDG
jgi:Fe-coproporphyrin III synthase